MHDAEPAYGTAIEIVEPRGDVYLTRYAWIAMDGAPIPQQRAMVACARSMAGQANVLGDVPWLERQVFARLNATRVLDPRAVIHVAGIVTTTEAGMAWHVRRGMSVPAQHRMLDVVRDLVA